MSRKIQIIQIDYIKVSSELIDDSMYFPHITHQFLCNPIVLKDKRRNPKHYTTILLDVIQSDEDFMENKKIIRRAIIYKN